MQKPKNFYLWLLLLSLFLPLLELFVFLRINDNVLSFALVISVSYLPISIISGMFLLYLLMNTKYRKAKRFVFLGYIISIFITIALSVVLRNIPVWIVSNIIGGAIILGGTFLAYLAKPKQNIFTI